MRAISAAILAALLLLLAGSGQAMAAVGVSVVAPAQGQSLANSHQAFEVTVSGAPVEEVGVTCVLDNAALPCAANTPFYVEQLANGGHTLLVAAWRRNDLADRALVTRSFTSADAAAPTLDLLWPLAGATIDQNFVAAFESDGASTLYCRLDATPYEPCEIVQTGDTLLGVFHAAPGALANGSHQFTARAADPAGNVTTRSRTFTVDDNANPTLELVEPQDGSTIAESPFNVFAGTDDDANGVACQVDGSPDEDCDDAHRDARPLALGNGPHTIAVTATDHVGRTAVATSSVVVDDTTPPVVTIDEPGGGQTLTDDLNGTVSVDQSAKVECRIDGGAWGACVQGGKSEWHVGAFSEPIAFAAANGAHTVEARATDGAGNVSTTSVSFVTADGAAPALDVLLPADGATVTSPLLVLPIGELSALCEFSVDGGTFKDCYGQPEDVFGIDLGAGNHTIAVRASDRAGNASTVTRNVTVPSPPSPPSPPTDGGGGGTPQPPPPPATPSKIKVVLGRIKVSKTAKGFALLVQGKLVNAGGPATCPASVEIAVSAGRKRVTKGTTVTRRVNGVCTFRKRLKVAKRYAGKRLDVRVTGGGAPVGGIDVTPFGGDGKVKLPRS